MAVIPANGACPGMTEAGGIHKCLKLMDPGFRRGDKILRFVNFYDLINIDVLFTSL